MFKRRQSNVHAEPTPRFWRNLSLQIAVTSLAINLSMAASAQEADVLLLPQLEQGFAEDFDSRIVNTGDIDIHVVTGGSGPAVLLLAGWPQSWYAWRHIMPTLAEDFTVVAADPRGSGLSDKPADGYDSATMATDMVKMMQELGHDEFMMVAHDIGMWTGYALAHEHPDAISRVAFVDAIIPGIWESPPLLGPGQMNAFMWHFAFNRAGEINEQMVQGREELYFAHQFATKAARQEAFPPEVVGVYVDMLRDPDVLRASFEYYRAVDQIMERNAVRSQTQLTLPVLAVGGQYSVGELVISDMKKVATDVTGTVIPGAGHFVPEEAPDELLEVLLPFLQEK